MKNFQDIKLNLDLKPGFYFTTKLKLVLDFLILLFFVFLIFLVNKDLFYNLSGSYGMAQTDNEGTLWWLWQQATSNSSDITSLKSGQVFESDIFSFTNIYDSMRIFIISKIGTIESLFYVFNLSIILSTALNSLACYKLSELFLPNRIIALGVSSVWLFTPHNLLNTRTGLSNNFLFFGLMLLVLFFKNFLKEKLNYLGIFLLSVLTAVSSTYLLSHVILICIVFSGVLLITDKSIKKTILLKMNSVIIITGALTTLVLYKKSLFLISDPEKTAKIRPNSGLQELVPHQTVIMNSSQTSAGFISIFSILIILIAVTISFSTKSFSLLSKIGLGILMSGFTMQYIGYSIPLLNPLQKIYFEIVPQLRGISLSHRFGLFLMVLGSVILISEYVLISGYWHKKMPTLVLILIFASNTLSIPENESFRQRTEVNSLAETYLILKQAPPNSIVFDFPDVLSSGDWGFPKGHILLSQIFHGKTISNGLDYNDSVKGCLPVSAERFQFALRSDGGLNADFIVLRDRQISSYNLKIIQNLLEDGGWVLIKKSSVDLVSNDSTLKSQHSVQIYKSPNKSDYKLGSFCRNNLGAK